MSEIEIAQKKLAVWQSSLKDQKLRFFQLEDTKRNQARQEGNKTKGLTAKLIGKNLFFQV